jgi:DNA-binding transcriptional ArsR family regulator
MRKPSALAAIIPPTRAMILAPLVMNPQKAWFLTELAKHLAVRHTTLQRELSSLARAGILKSWRDGGRRYYRADDSIPIFPELSLLLVKTVGLVDLLRRVLQPIQGHIDAAFVFGSMASQTDTAHSDVDLFVVGKTSLLEMSPILRTMESQILRPVNPVIYTREEFRTRTRRGDHFVTSVLAKPKLFVIGKMDDLVGRTPTARPPDRGTDQQTGTLRTASHGRARSGRRRSPEHLA